jgi:hypothetical protein
MRFQLDPISPSGISIVPEVSKPQTIVRQGANGYVVNKVTGLLTAGSNITLTGNGTQESPYQISSTGGGGGSGASKSFVVAMAVALG